MGINIKIKAANTKDQSYAQVSGSIEHIITEQERKSFKLSDGELKDYVNRYFGKKPDDAFLHSPTPWHDLYKTYGWNQVKVHLVAQSAKIMEITSEPVIIATKTLQNSSDQKATFNAGISDSVTNSVSNTWSKSNMVSVAQKFKYEIGFLGTGGGGETSFSYEHSWGESKTETKSTTVGSTSGVSVELEPNEAVKAQLTASRGVMKVRVTYKAFLTGSAAINYGHPFKGHHFWCLGIGSILSRSHLPSSLLVTEDIEVGFYSNSRVELLNAEGSMFSSHHSDDKPAPVEKATKKAA